jgi:hypothetical protein
MAGGLECDKKKHINQNYTCWLVNIVYYIFFFYSKRRNRFFRRQAEKRQQNEKNKNIPPSYSKLPSLDEVSEVSKFKLFERITMNHRVSLDEVSEVSSLNCLNVLQWITG